jgi:hypothetical protein
MALFQLPGDIRCFRLDQERRLFFLLSSKVDLRVAIINSFGDQHTKRRDFDDEAEINPKI